MKQDSGARRPIEGRTYVLCVVFLTLCRNETFHWQNSESNFIFESWKNLATSCYRRLRSVCCGKDRALCKRLLHLNFPGSSMGIQTRPGTLVCRSAITMHAVHILDRQPQQRHLRAAGSIRYLVPPHYAEVGRSEGTASTSLCTHDHTMFAP